MPAYHFIALHTSGQAQKGVLEAESEKHARQLLREKSLVPVRVRPAQEKKTARLGAWALAMPKWKDRLSHKELSLLTRQLAILLAAGLPVEESLQAVAEQTESPKTKGLVFSVRSKVLAGHALASALREHPDCFSALFCSTVAAGEKSGHLDKVLLRLADYTEQQWQVRQKLRTALIYPIMIVFVAMGIVTFLLAYVVPKMVAVYGHLNQSLPALTKGLILLSQAVQSYGPYVLLALIGAVYMFRRAIRKSASLREKAHQLMLRLPLMGHALKTSETARFARTLAILSTSGVSVLEAMRIATQLITMLPIHKALDIAWQRVREGAAIHLALKQTAFFSPMSVHMIASGEASGQLAPLLERVADSQEEEIKQLIDTGLALFEPAMVLIMGVIVLFIVLAVLLPIFELNQFTG